MRKPRSRRGLAPSPSPSNGEGGHAYRQAGRRPGKSRLGRSLALPVGRSSRSTPFNLRPNQTKSDQIKPNPTKSNQIKPNQTNQTNQTKAGRQPNQGPGAHRPPLQPEPFEALIGTNTL